MTTDAQQEQGEQDFRDKMRFEAAFTRELTRYFDDVVSAFRTRGLSRLPFNVRAQFDERLAKILLNHYERVEVPFSTRIRDRLPREIRSTVKEDADIATALSRFNGIRSQLQAKNINDTTQRNIVESLELANSFDDDQDTLEDGVIVRRKIVGFELILTAGAILRRKLKNRTPTISATETQVAAEVAKLTEVEILSGLSPSISGGDTRPSTVTKIWVTQGDDIVRDTHLAADGQEVKSDKPFMVGGFPLRVPGDTSMGAPLKETANCRCAAVFNDEDVIAIRFNNLIQEPFIARG